MELGLFAQPVHRPEKEWLQALEEDREAIILADQLGFSEAWIGEHFTTKAEQIPSPADVYGHITSGCTLNSASRLA